jgi:hypothetical protein
MRTIAITSSTKVGLTAHSLQTAMEILRASSTQALKTSRRNFERHTIRGTANTTKEERNVT